MTTAAQDSRDEPPPRRGAGHIVARTLVVLVLVVLVWRVLATLSVRGQAIAATAPAVQLERLTADFNARVRWSLDDDAELFFALARHVPADAMVMLYATEVPDLEHTRDRMVLLQLRLQALRYPAEVPMGYGPFEHAAAYASLLQDGMWLVNVTPSTPVPLAEAFDVVERTDAFELSRCVMSRR